MVTPAEPPLYRRPLTKPAPALALDYVNHVDPPLLSGFFDYVVWAIPTLCPQDHFWLGISQRLHANCRIWE